MLVFPKKPEPTNREASQVIGRWITPLPCWADMQTVKRRCVQTAHISLQISSFQRAQTQNKRTANLLARPAALHSGSLAIAFASAFRRRRLHRCVSSSSVRRYLRMVASHRKRKNRINLHFSVTPHVYRRFSRPRHSAPCQADPPQAASGAPRWPNHPLFAPDSQPQAANPCPWWVIRPPDTVRAMPVWPICSAGIVSMSPSIITRSAASPGISRPVSPSRCPAQAPPAV